MASLRHDLLPHEHSTFGFVLPCSLKNMQVHPVYPTKKDFQNLSVQRPEEKTWPTLNIAIIPGIMQFWPPGLVYKERFNLIQIKLGVG